jgi:hypothetical protein
VVDLRLVGHRVDILKQDQCVAAKLMALGTKFVGMIVPPIGLALLLPLMEASLVLAPFHTIG